MNQNIIKKLKLAPYVHSHPETESVVHPSPPLGRGTLRIPARKINCLDILSHRIIKSFSGRWRKKQHSIRETAEIGPWSPGPMPSKCYCCLEELLCPGMTKNLAEKIWAGILLINCRRHRRFPSQGNNFLVDMTRNYFSNIQRVLKYHILYKQIWNEEWCRVACDLLGAMPPDMMAGSN